MWHKLPTSDSAGVPSSRAACSLSCCAVSSNDARSGSPLPARRATKSSPTVPTAARRLVCTFDHQEQWRVVVLDAELYQASKLRVDENRAGSRLTSSDIGRGSSTDRHSMILQRCVRTHQARPLCLGKHLHNTMRATCSTACPTTTLVHVPAAPGITPRSP